MYDSVYYCRTYEKAVSGGEARLRELEGLDGLSLSVCCFVLLHVDHPLSSPPRT
jgi:hypothetical protein